MSDDAERRPHRRPTRRAVVAGLLGVTAPFDVPAQNRLVLGDASNLNAVPVFSHWITRGDPQADWLARLRDMLKLAAAERRPVCVSAARHTMGGQSLPRNGRAITLDIDRCEIDSAARAARLHGGTRWFQAIAHLDAQSLSPAVMQSNSDFGIASTFSVNAHGWPAPFGPFGSTVRAIRLMLADGSIVACSRTVNAELFGLAMGGYGLVGIILEVEIDVVENTLLSGRAELLRSEDFGHRFAEAVRRGGDVRMAYGRMDVSHRSLLGEALMFTFHPLPTPAEGLPATRRDHALAGLTRRIYRAQIGSETGKQARWLAEKNWASRGPTFVATRNTLMNQPVAALGNRDRRRTDILHEYFLPPERLADFIAGARPILLRASAEFLNVTLRWVATDVVSVLAYAPADRIAAVMSFSQEISQEGEADMIRLSEALTELVLSLGGSFYLPYRLHARQDQFERTYSRAQHFAERKRAYDPGLLFRNGLWDTYFTAT